MKKHLYNLHALSQSGDDFPLGNFSPFAEFGFSIAGNLSIFHENLGHGTAVSDAGGLSSLINSMYSVSISNVIMVSVFWTQR